jgi:hypothetical protein
VADRLLDDRTEPPPRARRSAFAAAAAPRRLPPVRPPADLRRIETLVAARIVTAAGVYYWLRPLLADLTMSRLRHRGDADLGDPSRSTSVPDPLWGLVRPDRRPPVERDGPGLSLSELALAVDQLEAL